MLIEDDDQMVQLDINDEEREILVGVLDSYMSDLRMEISNTDSQDVREMLKTRKDVLKKVRDSLRGWRANA